MFRFICIFASAALLTAASAHASQYQLSLLDFDAAIDNGDIVFAPYKNSTRGTGYVWFRDYEYDYVLPAPGAYRTKTLTVSFVPQSILSGALKAFTEAYNLRPNRKVLLPENATLCQPTEVLQQLLVTFEYVSVSTRPQGYPKLCSLVIRYQTTAEKEEKLFQLIDTKRLMHLKFALSDPESQSVPGVYIEVPSIVQHLAERKVLEQQWPLSAGDASTTGSHHKAGWYGFERGIHFYAAQLDPALFGFAEGPVDSSLLFQRWSQLVDLFQPVEGHPDLKMISKQLAAEKIVLSAPVPSTPLLEVSY